MAISKGHPSCGVKEIPIGAIIWGPKANPGDEGDASHLRDELRAVKPSNKSVDCPLVRDIFG
jgi:hypothetical protein